MEENMHTIYRMQLHLPGQQRIYFKEGGETTAANLGNRETMLMGWFQLNKNNPSAQSLLYSEVGENYVWNKTTREWTIRKVRNEYCIFIIFN
jgi:hypothetical protein